MGIHERGVDCVVCRMTVLRTLTTFTKQHMIHPQRLSQLLEKNAVLQRLDSPGQISARSRYRDSFTAT